MLFNVLMGSFYTQCVSVNTLHTWEINWRIIHTYWVWLMEVWNKKKQIPHFRHIFKYRWFKTWHPFAYYDELNVHKIDFCNLFF